MGMRIWKMNIFSDGLSLWNIEARMETLEI